MGRRMTQDEFVDKLNAKTNSAYEVLSEYLGYNNKINVKHLKCGNTFSSYPRNLIRGGCKYCDTERKKRKMSQQEFVDKINKKTNKAYEIIGDYKGNNVKIEVKHLKCGNHFSSLPSNLTKGKCAYCGNNKKLNTDTFKKRVLKLEGDSYSVLGEYVNAHTKIKMKHERCGEEYYVRPHDFTHDNNRCPACDIMRIKDTHYTREKINELSGGGYCLLGEYQGARVKIKVKHLDCGNSYMVEPYAFYAGSRCPSCNGSRGEKEIQEFMLRLGLNFESQYRIPDCKYKKPLPFDFVLFSKTNTIVMLIEFDGQHHYQPVNFGGKTDEEIYLSFKIQKIKDNIKNAYCEENNIPLLRIPYWNFENIEHILFEKLVELKIIDATV